MILRFRNVTKIKYDILCVRFKEKKKCEKNSKKIK